jgi:serine/threonine-protein kinase
MPPEQAQGDLPNIGPWSDQYSAGVVLYHLLTGRVPFRKPLAAGLLNEIISAPPPPPSSLRPGLDPELDRIVLKALQKNRSARYRDCREFAERLRQWSGRHAGGAAAGRGAGGRSKVWVIAAGAVLVVALLAAGGYFLLRNKGPGAGASSATAPATGQGKKREWQGD